MPRACVTKVELMRDVLPDGGIEAELPRPVDSSGEQVPRSQAAKKLWPMFRPGAMGNKTSEDNMLLKTVTKRKRVPQKPAGRVKECDVISGSRLKGWLRNSQKGRDLEASPNMLRCVGEETEDNHRLHGASSVLTRPAVDVRAPVCERGDNSCVMCGGMMTRVRFRETETTTRGVVRQIAKLSWICRLQCKNLDVAFTAGEGNQTTEL